MGKNSSDEIDLSRIFYLIHKHKNRILCLALAGLLLGAVLTGVGYLKHSRNPRHVITCSFAVVAKNSAGSYGSNSASPDYNDVKLAEDIVQSVVFVVKSDRVLSTAIEQKHFLGISNDDLRSHMSVQQHDKTQIITLKLMWPNAAEGMSLVQSICEVTPDILIETLNLGSVSVVDYPKDTGIEEIGGRWKLLPLAFTLLFAGTYLAVLFLQLLLHPTLSDVKTIPTEFNGLECIGIIPNNEQYYAQRPFPLPGDDPDAYEMNEAFVSSAYVISNLAKREGYRCFYVTSSEAGEGKTSVVANLALQLSLREHKVLVVDMDTRRPSLGSCFFESVDHAHSLNAVYEGSVSLAEAVLTVTPTLDVLAGRLEKQPVRIDTMLRAQLKDFFVNYDIVLLDAPPIGLVADTASLNPLADRAILVAAFDRVWLSTIHQNIEKLRSTGIETCGMVVTNVNRHLGSGYSSYYRSYSSSSSYYRREEKTNTTAKPKKKARFSKK